MRTLKERLELSEKLFEETGKYQGIDLLELKEEDPLNYEAFNAKLRSLVINARETSKKISASPGIREVGESVVALYTPEGDAVALSTGILVHVHTMSRFIKWMIENDYENDPGIKQGDIFANNDPFIADVHQADLMVVMPIFHEDVLVGWAGAVTHQIEVGGVVGGANMEITVERFGNGLTVSGQKIGEHDEIRRDFFIQAEYNLRTPIYWVLDSKGMVSACIDVREKVLEIVEKYGTDYYMKMTKELIEEGRRGILAKVKALTVPGRYFQPVFSAHFFSNKPGISPLARDLILHEPVEVIIDTEGKVKIDLDGLSSESWSPENASITAADGLFFVVMTQHFGYDGKVNDGAWLAVEQNIPKGSCMNPSSHLVSIGGIWGFTIPIYGAFQVAISRAFLARGYKEEIFLGQVVTPLMEGGGINQYGQRFGGQNLEACAQGSGARGIMDGIDTGYVGWNPESDMGNIEIWEQMLPILYLGRRIWTDSGGPGKYRGGCAMSSLLSIWKTPLYAILSTVHPDHMFDNCGLCGGYPAPTAKYTHVVEGSDIKERAKKKLPLPHVEGNSKDPDCKKLLNGDFRTEKGRFYYPLKEGDVLQFFYSPGPGYGDPIERSIDLVKKDLDDGYASQEAVERIYKVKASYDAQSCEWVINANQTEKLREQERKERLKRSVPVTNWYEKERPKIIGKKINNVVLEMYKDAINSSAKFKESFFSFWQIGDEISF